MNAARMQSGGGFCQGLFERQAAKAIGFERLSETQICVSFELEASSVLNGRIRARTAFSSTSYFASWKCTLCTSKVGYLIGVE